jgi:hypothetical protein
MIPLLAMIRKDLQLFFSDRRSVIVSFVVPIAIASFFGSIFNGPRTGEPAKIAVMVIDQDETAISKAIVAGTSADRNLKVTVSRCRLGARFGASRQDRGGGDHPERFRRRSRLRVFQQRRQARARTRLRPVAQHRARDGARHHDPARDGSGQPRDVWRRAGPEVSRAITSASRIIVRPGRCPEAALLQMLRSVQGFYNTPGEPGRAAMRHAASPCRTP